MPLNAYDRVKTEKIIKEEQEKRWKEEGLSVRRVYLMKGATKITETKKIVTLEHFLSLQRPKDREYQLPPLKLLNDPPVSAEISKEEL